MNVLNPVAHSAVEPTAPLFASSWVALFMVLKEHLDPRHVNPAQEPANDNHMKVDIHH